MQECEGCEGCEGTFGKSVLVKVGLSFRLYDVRQRTKERQIELKMLNLSFFYKKGMWFEINIVSLPNLYLVYYT